jgi:hypothetical protein
MVMTHPRVLARGTRMKIKEPEAITQVIPRTVVHVIVYAPTPERMRWVEQELKVDTAIQRARDVAELVAVLVEDSRTRPQLLVIDLDSLSAGELFHVHQIREHGWCGEIVALGQVPPSLRASLKITHTIRAPFVEHALSDALIRHRCATEDRTMPLPVFPDEPRVEHKTYG